MMTSSPAYTTLELQTSNEDQDVPAPIVETGGRAWQNLALDIVQVAGYVCVATVMFALIFVPHYLWYKYMTNVDCGCAD